MPRESRGRAMVVGSLAQYFTHTPMLFCTTLLHHLAPPYCLKNQETLTPCRGFRVWANRVPLGYIVPFLQMAPLPPFVSCAPVPQNIDPPYFTKENHKQKQGQGNKQSPAIDHASSLPIMGAVRGAYLVFLRFNADPLNLPCTGFLLFGSIIYRTKYAQHIKRHYNGRIFQTMRTATEQAKAGSVFAPC